MKIIYSLLVIGSMFFAGNAIAETEEFSIIIKDHKFTPEVLEVPAGEKFKLVIDNQDPTPEEFESHSLNREKIIQGNSKGTVFVGPLKAGEYDYFGEFNEDSAKGKIVAR
ncbi:cupredoxin domain-containing protein [Rickettsiales bacterium]|nr:cupredoxin domain-containing protein [Rickettsiales bacterium]